MEDFLHRRAEGPEKSGRGCAESAANLAPFHVGRGISKPSALGPHIIIHDEVSKSERDGFSIDLSSRARTLSFLPVLADACLTVL